MRFLYRFPQPFYADVGVDLGGGEAFVAEELLDGFEVGAVVEEVGCEAVAEGVGGDVGREPGSECPFFHYGLDAAGGESLALGVGEEGGWGVAVLRCCGVEVWKCWGVGLLKG